MNHEWHNRSTNTNTEAAQTRENVFVVHNRESRITSRESKLALSFRLESYQSHESNIHDQLFEIFTNTGFTIHTVFGCRQRVCRSVTAKRKKKEIVNENVVAAKARVVRESTFDVQYVQ